jgi:single-strand DNA-binding protein
MGRGVNKVIIVGNLGADPDCQYTKSGVAVVKLSVATTESIPAGEGKWDEKTEWHRIVAFGKIAENCQKYLSKGRQVYVEGRLQTRQWEDAQGVKRFTTEIVAREIQFLGGNGGDQAAGGVYAASHSGSAGGTAGGPAPGPAGITAGGPDDDIPF